MVGQPQPAIWLPRIPSHPLTLSVGHLMPNMDKNATFASGLEFLALTPKRIHSSGGGSAALAKWRTSTGWERLPAAGLVDSAGLSMCQL